MDVGDAALNLRQAADIEFTGLGHHRRIGRQIMLRADSQIAARGKGVGEERVLGVLDGVAVIDDRNRQRDHAGIGLHFLVAPNGNLDGNQTVVARRIMERDGLMRIAHLLAVKYATTSSTVSESRTAIPRFIGVLGAPAIRGHF